MDNQPEATILVVDDDVTLSKRLVSLLTREGYKTIAASSADEAEELMNRELPDLVITDYHMPGRNGFSLLAAIRQSAQTQHLPVILLTGEKGEAIARSGHKNGIDVFLSKPVEVESFLAVVDRQVRRALLAGSRIDSFRDHIAATIPHELRTPLAGIIGMGSLLTNHAESLQGNRAQIEEFGRAILASGERLRRLVESYLLHARLSAAERLTIGPDVSPTLDLTHEARITAEQLADKAGRSADIRFSASPDALIASGAWVETVVKIEEELVDNAFKFSEAGTAVSVTVRALDSVVCLSVTDSGRGMTDDEIAQIGPFVQFQRERYEQQGSGLGLSLAQRLSESVEGELLITGKPGQGLNVELTCPREATRVEGHDRSQDNDSAFASLAPPVFDSRN